MDLTKFSDNELYRKCSDLGAVILKYRRQFCGLLPEVEWRKLYEKHGMHSIYEFAAKLAGLSRETVQEVLRVHTLLKDKPLLQEKLVNGEVGYTKMRAVVSMVRPETQKEWLEKLETMSKTTLEMYVGELKKQNQIQPDLPGKASEKVDLFCENRSAFSGDVPLGETQEIGGRNFDEFVTLSFTVKTKTAAKMRIYKKRIEKKLKKPLNWDEVLQILLQGNNLKPRRRKHSPTVRAVSQDLKPRFQADQIIRVRRYIPANIRHQLEEKYEDICAFPRCSKPAEILHHTERFALKPHHNTQALAPLCKGHERIAHHSLIANESDSPTTWKVLWKPDKNHPKYRIDQMVQKFRKPP